MLLVSVAVFSAPPPARTPPTSTTTTESLSSMKTHITDLKHRLSGVEQSIRSLKEQIDNQDTSVLHFREEVGQEMQEGLRESSMRCTDVENQFSSFKSGLQAVMEDLSSMRVRLNELITITKEQQEKIVTLESGSKVQAAQIKLLESALSSLTKLLQGKATPSITSGEALKTYRVQPGDTLEKIAKQHKVTVAAIREINQLEDLDKIRVNQTLKIP